MRAMEKNMVAQILFLGVFLMTIKHLHNNTVTDILIIAIEDYIPFLRVLYLCLSAECCLL